MDEYIKKTLTIKISDLNPDPLSIFYQKTVVVTGTLEQYARADIEKALKLIGANVTKAVSIKTDFLIVGHQDFYKVLGTMSTKEITAFNLNKKGANIKIMDQDEFYEYFD